MKRAATWATMLVAVVAVCGSALPGPFVRVEQTWGTGLVLQAGLANQLLTKPIYSIKTAALEAYAGKANPFTILGWWTFGAGSWIITDYLPHLNVGGGIRFLVNLANVNGDPRLTDAAWGVYGEAGWWFGPFQVLGRLNWFYSFDPAKPVGFPYLSFGVTIDLGVLRGVEAISGGRTQ